MKRVWLCCLMVCVLLGAAAPTLADDILVGSDTPRWGEVNLGMIDFPDPFIVTVLSGGPFNAQAQDGIPAECRGFVSGNPDYRVNMVAEDWALLRIFVVSQGDTTLIVQLPDGSWQCSDDGGSAALPLSPVVDIANPELGPYNIWVGSFQGDELLGAYLMITENASTLPGQIVSPMIGSVINSEASSTTPAGSDGGSDSTLNCSSGLNFACTPNYGTAVLEAGFIPDPYTVRITSGGSVNVTEQGLPAECRGNVTTPPDFRLNLSSTSARIRIYFVADNAGDDTTLIVNSASATWVCSDDYPNANLNPMVEVNNALAGQYDIWVGSFTPGEFVSGTLYITEMDRTPANP